MGSFALRFDWLPKLNISSCEFSGSTFRVSKFFPWFFCRSFLVSWKTTEKTVENFPGSPKYNAKHWALASPPDLLRQFLKHWKSLSNPKTKSWFILSSHNFIFIIVIFQAYIKVNTLLNDFLTSRGVTQITVQPEFPRTVAIENEEDGFNSFEKTKESSSQSQRCVTTDECNLPCADVWCEAQRCCKPLK